MGSDGFLQHPNIPGIEPEDYDALIADPVAGAWEKVVPKFYKELAKPAPLNMLDIAEILYSQN